jgi:hypothetical protein
MKFQASILLALLLIPAESASEPNGCILGANRKTSCKSSQKPQNSFESVTSVVRRVPPVDRKVSH